MWTAKTTQLPVARPARAQYLAVGISHSPAVTRLERRSLVALAQGDGEKKGQWPDSVKKAMDKGKQAVEDAGGNVIDAIGGLEGEAAKAAESVKDAVPDDAPAGFDKVKARRKATDFEGGGPGEDKRTGQGWPFQR